VQKTLKTPAIEAAWKKNGSPMPTLTGADFGTFVTAEVERWGKVVKEAQVKLE
jgi:tripartite-type tricarboxylate transporter receptor subunit TctC